MKVKGEGWEEQLEAVHGAENDAVAELPPPGHAADTPTPQILLFPRLQL